MPLQICVDVSVALKLVLAEAESEEVRARWRGWVEDGTELVAPPLFIFEGVSAIRLNITRKHIAAEDAELAFHAFLNHVQDVHLPLPSGLHERAWNLAKRLKQSQVYDAYYLALSESLGCEFWTADQKLYAAAHRTLPWVKLIQRSQ